MVGALNDTQSSLIPLVSLAHRTLFWVANYYTLVGKPFCTPAILTRYSPGTLGLVLWTEPEGEISSGWTWSLFGIEVSNTDRKQCCLFRLRVSAVSHFELFHKTTDALAHITPTACIGFRGK
jgi:hypothetical protein